MHQPCLGLPTLFVSSLSGAAVIPTNPTVWGIAFGLLICAITVNSIMQSLVHPAYRHLPPQAPVTPVGALSR